MLMHRAERMFIWYREVLKLACVCVLGANAKSLLCPLALEQNDDVPDGLEEVCTDQYRLEPRSDDEDT